jgi:hypothetical protein
MFEPVPCICCSGEGLSRVVRQRVVQETIEASLIDIDNAPDIPMPDNLEERIREKLDGSARSWDQVLWDLVDIGETGGSERQAPGWRRASYRFGAGRSSEDGCREEPMRQ